MSDMFSEEMKKELIKIINNQIVVSKVVKILDQHQDVYMGIEKNVKDINDRLVEIEDIANDFENAAETSIDEITFINRMNELEQQIQSMHDGSYVQQDEIENLVSKIMLKLMPDFNKKISKEIKKHLVALAEFVIKNFKEKE